MDSLRFVVWLTIDGLQNEAEVVFIFRLAHYIVIEVVGFQFVVSHPKNVVDGPVQFECLLFPDLQIVAPSIGLRRLQIPITNFMLERVLPYIYDESHDSDVHRQLLMAAQLIESLQFLF